MLRRIFALIIRATFSSLLMPPSLPHTSSDDDPVLTTREVADMLGVAVSTAQQWIESGAVSAWKTPGGHRRVRRSAVLQVLDGQALASEEAASSHLPPAAEFMHSAESAYPVGEDEPARLLALRAKNLVGISENKAFDRLTWLAGEITDTPIALITLLTAKRQWFLSRCGVDLHETPREWAFCSHAILQDDLFMVEDALQDDRFRTNPLVTGEPHIRFYAGIPLTDGLGFRMGTLCVLDRESRRLREKEIRALRELAVITSEELKRYG